MASASKTLRLKADNPADILRAAQILRAGGTLAFPTETVYGLGANALSIKAVEKIFLAKQRPHWDPLIVHLADPNQLPQIATSNPIADRLMASFWPGPFTILLPKTPAIPYSVTAGRPLVGVRIPNHPVAQALLRAAAIPIAAPSANSFGHTSPTTAAHVLADLDGRIDAVLDGGPTHVGLESTVAEVTPGGIVVYRPGAITLHQIESATGLPAWLHIPESGAALPGASPESLPSPGVGLRHYAPRARLILVSADEKDLEHSLLDELNIARNNGLTVGAMLPNGWAVLPVNRRFSWGDWNDPAELAHRLFDGLRFLDDRGVDLIVCPVPTGSGLAEAIRDRLQKAARS